MNRRRTLLTGLVTGQGGGSVATGADALLSDEVQGLAIDATGVDGLGQVSIKDTGTPANNRSNVAINSLFINLSAHPKRVRDISGVYGWSPHNLVAGSDDASVGVGIQSGATITANAAADPDGNMVADKIDLLSTGFIYWRMAAESAVAGEDFCPAFFIRSDAPVTVRMRTVGATDVRSDFSVTTSWQQIFQTSKGVAATAMDFGIDPRGAVGGDDAAKSIYICRKQIARGTTPLTHSSSGTLPFVSAPIDFVAGTPALLSERVRTQSLFPSDVPATQTRSLVAGTYALWVIGSGSCALSGGPTGTATAGSPVQFTLGGTTSVTFTVTGSLSFIQCENGIGVTSPIRSFSGSVTRPNDTVRIATTAFPYSATVGTAYIKAQTNDVDIASTGNLWGLFKDSSNRITAMANATQSNLACVTGGVQVVGLNAGTLQADIEFQFSTAYAANDFAASQDGDVVVTDTSGTLPTAATHLYVGNQADTGFNVPGALRIKEFVYVPRRVSNAALPTW